MRGEKFLHRNAVAFIEVVEVETECIVLNLAKNWEWYDFLVVTGLHKVDVWVGCQVLGNSFLSKLVESLLVDEVRSMLRLMTTISMMSVQ